MKSHSEQSTRRTQMNKTKRKKKEKGDTDMDSLAGASTSLNLLTSAIASFSIAATKPEQKSNQPRSERNEEGTEQP